MEKKKYAIIGKPISHSLSPILHNYWFKKYKIDAEYNLLEIQEKELASVIKKISDNRLHGLNVTLPYKQKVISHLGKTINDAGESYSVNTIFKDEEDNIIGENTDVFGFQAGYLKNIINLEKKKTKSSNIRGGWCFSFNYIGIKKITNR
jgi:shikimate dehydrogenase